MHSLSPRITIALDGYAACGKSTLARDLCEALNYSFIDTGAMYRAVTWWILDQQIHLDHAQPWPQILQDLPFDWILQDGTFRIFMNGKEMEEQIRSMDVSAQVSAVASVSGIRAFLVRLQQQLGRAGGVVLDGRDIGTVVFPDAELKVFVTAETEVRVERRLSELLAKGVHVTRSEVRTNLVNRDRIDSTRKDSPLQAAPDALWLDTSRMDRGQQLRIVLDKAADLVRKKHRSAAGSVVVP